MKMNIALKLSLVYCGIDMFATLHLIFSMEEQFAALHENPDMYVDLVFR